MESIKEGRMKRAERWFCREGSTSWHIFFGSYHKVLPPVLLQHGESHVMSPK